MGFLDKFFKSLTGEVHQPPQEDPKSIPRYKTVGDLMRSETLQHHATDPWIGYFRMNVCGETAERYLRGGDDQPPCRVRGPDGQFYCGAWVPEVAKYVSREINPKKKPGERGESGYVCRHLEAAKGVTPFRLGDNAGIVASLFPCDAAKGDEKRQAESARLTMIKKRKASGDDPSSRYPK